MKINLDRKSNAYYDQIVPTRNCVHIAQESEFLEFLRVTLNQKPKLSQNTRFVVRRNIKIIV